MRDNQEKPKSKEKYLPGPWSEEKPWLSKIDDWTGTWREDYRIINQDAYLMNRELIYMKFDPAICFEDYTQCEFCWAVFDKDPKHPLNAFHDPISRTWICEKCFKDFKPYFNWTVNNKTE